MWPLEVLKYIHDIQQACDRLSKFIAGRTLEDYSSDDMLRSAVERQFEIVGEALNRMLKRNPDLSARVSDWKLIIAFRNRLIHGYADIDDEVVWGILESNLPLLQREIDDLLADDNN